MARTKERVKQTSGGDVKGKALAYALLSSIKKGESVPKAELMRRAGYAPATINARQTRAWNSRGFIEAMQEAGLGVESIQKVVKEAMEAKAVVTYQGDAKETDAPDHAIRLRATELAAKYTGLDVQRSQSVNINIDAQLDDAFDAFGI